MKTFYLYALLLCVIVVVVGSQVVNVKTNARPPKTYAEHLAAVKQMLIPAERKPLAAPKPPPVEPEDYNAGPHRKVQQPVL
jgi:hypothetical protein